MKLTKRIAIIISAVIIIFAGAFVINAAGQNISYGEELAAGKFGQYGTWVLYDSGTMVCTGTRMIDNNMLTVSPTKIDDAYSEKVTKIVFDNNTESIGALYSSFKIFKNLKEVELSDSVVEIGSSAFSGCAALEKINIPESVKYIKNAAFYDCTSLCSIQLPQNLEQIGSAAFYNSGYYKTASNWINGYFLYCGKYLIKVDSKIKDEIVSLSNKTVMLADSAFGDCKNIKEVYIPDSITFISGACFDGATNLSTVHLPDSITEIRFSAFSRCTSLNRITLPENLITIDYNAFRKCSSLNQIEIPESVEKIGECAFAESGVTTVRLSKNIKSLGNVFDFYPNDTQYTVYYGSDKKDWLNLIGKDLTEFYYRNNYTIYYTMTSPDGDISVQYTDGDFDWDAGNLRIAFETLPMDTPAAEQYGAFIYRNKAQSKNLYAVTLMDSFGEKAQPLDSHPVKVGFKIGNDTAFNERSFIYHWFSEKIDNDFEKIPYEKLTFENGWVYCEINHFSDFAFCNELTEIIPVKIEVVSAPQTVRFKSDLSGVQLKVSYSDGSSKIITDMSEFSVSGFNSSKTGDQTVTVTYGTLKTSFKVQVKYVWWQWIIRILLFGWIWY